MSQSTLTPALSGLREIARSLSTTVDLDSTLNLIVNKTTGVMGVDSCSIYLLEADNITLRLKASTGLRAQAVGYSYLEIGQGMTGVAVTQNRPIFAAVAATHPDFKLVDYADEEDLTSLLAVPLVVSNRPIGALNVQTRDQHDYTSEEINLLSLISELAAGAVAKAQIHDAQRSQLADLRALAEVSEAVVSPQYLDDMLDVVTDMAARTMDAAVCSLFMLNESGDMLEMRSAKRLTSSYQKRAPLAVGEGIIGSVAKTGQVEYVGEISAESRYANPDLAKADGFISMLAVPLSVRDQTIGVVACYTTEPREFSDEQIALFSTIANQTALAIENARLVTHAAVVREMHHRIKNNLQMVAMLMRLQIPDADRLDTRDVLTTNIHRIHSIATVHEVLSEKGWHLVDVRDVLERIARATVQAVNAPNRTIAIDVLGESLTLRSQTATALALVVNELVQNAVEHAFAERINGTITVSIGRAAGTIYVRVRDDGIGISDNVSPGLGLEIAETLVSDDLEGTITYNRLATGTEIEIAMPQSIERSDES